jgi:hypothetical protein
MKLTPLTALFLIACGTSASSQPAESTEVGSAAEAIRALGRNDADVVARCEQIVERCESFAGDSGVGSEVCERISEHCTELAEQLAEARADFQECLEQVAACEAAATDPADCRDERQACNPRGKDFEARRGETLACSERTQSCMPRMRSGRDDGADAGANSCDGDALDFVGCCHGHGGGRGPGGFGPGAGDAGAVPPFGPPRFGGNEGPRPPRPGDDPRRGDDADAGAGDQGNFGRGNAGRDDD